MFSLKSYVVILTGIKWSSLFHLWINSKKASFYFRATCKLDVMLGPTF
jgi:hypothetical protein